MCVTIRNIIDQIFHIESAHLRRSALSMSRKSSLKMTGSTLVLPRNAHIRQRRQKHKIYRSAMEPSGSLPGRLRRLPQHSVLSAGADHTCRIISFARLQMLSLCCTHPSLSNSFRISGQWASPLLLMPGYYSSPLPLFHCQPRTSGKSWPLALIYCLCSTSLSLMS